MTESTTSRSVEIRNPKGMHMRPADLLVRLASRFQSDIEIVRDGERFDAKSMLSVMTMAAEQGTRLVLHAQGPDADRALDALVELFERGFDESVVTSEPDPSAEP